jgi:thiol-disulfide isomerase/thioredoxin
VNVEVIGGPAFKRALKQYQGKVVLVDFWAPWCGPCVEMSPKTVDLHRRFADRGLVVVGVSMDDPEDKQQVAEFLAKHGAAFPNYLSRYGVGAEGAEAFGVGPLPCYKLYDRAGELVKEFSGAGIDAGELEREIEKLLAQP